MWNVAVKGVDLQLGDDDSGFETSDWLDWQGEKWDMRTEDMDTSGEAHASPVR